MFRTSFTSCVLVALVVGCGKTSAPLDQVDTPPVVASESIQIEVNDSTRELGLGRSRVYSVVAKMSDGTRDVVDEVSWEIEIASVATVDEFGAISGLATGTTLVTATAAGHQASFDLTVVAGFTTAERETCDRWLAMIADKTVAAGACLGTGLTGQSCTAERTHYEASYQAYGTCVVTDAACADELAAVGAASAALTDCETQTYAGATPCRDTRARLLEECAQLTRSLCAGDVPAACETLLNGGAQ